MKSFTTIQSPKMFQHLFCDWSNSHRQPILILFSLLYWWRNETKDLETVNHSVELVVIFLHRFAGIDGLCLSLHQSYHECTLRPSSSSWRSDITCLHSRICVAIAANILYDNDMPLAYVNYHYNSTKWVLSNFGYIFHIVASKSISLPILQLMHDWKLLLRA